MNGDMMNKGLLRAVASTCARPVRRLQSMCRPTDEIPLHKIARHLNDHPIILEAGAADGKDTERLARFWPSGNIHALEPIASAFAELRNRTAHLPNVSVHHLALGTSRGEADMFVSTGRSRTDSSSLLPPSGHKIEIPDVAFSTQQRVPTLTLDEWAHDHRIERLDFLWLDLQGYEMAVLSKAHETLKKVSVIHTEVSVREMYAGAALYPELKRLLDDHGFSPRIERIPKGWPQGNVLFVRR